MATGSERVSSEREKKDKEDDRRMHWTHPYSYPIDHGKRSRRIGTLFASSFASVLALEA